MYKRQPVWCRIRITGLADKSGRVVRAVGAILDIDAEKRKAQNLMERAQRDMLTKLYNKGTSQESVSYTHLDVYKRQDNAFHGPADR